VDDVGGAIAKAPYEAQIELYDLLIDGCQEAVKENTDIKVKFIVMPLREI
jgi:chromodomain-helicase-DNA-binding protein 1